MPIQPLPCSSGGAGEAGADVEQALLCDVLPNGDIAGTALAVYEYDATGSPVGAPTFVDPATGLPYVAQGVLQPCPGDIGCGQPTQFCFASTGEVEQPGRMYDTVLTLAQGFPVQALVKDLVETPLNIVWEVTDPDGTAFAASLQTALQSQFPGQTVTVTPGVVDPCTGGTADFAIHIECLRIDQNPPTLLQLKYNGGRDLILNPAFLSNPPQGNFAFLKRQDEASGVSVADVLCTNVANRGWETNDINNSYETWGPPGSPYNVGAGTTPPPRGTVIQEINSYGSGPQTNPGFGDNPNTIWQTFTVLANGNFTVRVVVGGRAGTENIAIKLSTGDVDDTGIGDIINTSVNAGQVTTQDGTGASTGTGTAGPWTTFNQTVPLAAGTYTLAFTGPDQPLNTPGGNAFGGLFTDMRVFQDAPNTIEAFTNDDDTCTVPTNETSTICEFWAPRCAGGQIVGWYNVADGEELTNAAFWAQVPAPTCCSGTSGGGSSSTGNLVYTYLVCGTLNGERRTMSRVVVSDQSGGIIADSFVDTDGGPVTPDTWQPGDCAGDSPVVGEFVLCDDTGPFVRKLIQNAQGVVTQVVNVTLAGAPYIPAGAVRVCEECAPSVLGDVCVTTSASAGTVTAVAVQACDGTMTFLNKATGEPWPDASGPVECPPPTRMWEEILCDQGNGGQAFRRIYRLTELGSVEMYNETLEAGQYLPVGPVGLCDAADTEVVALCDFTGDPPVIAVTSVGQAPLPAGDAPLPAVVEVNDWVTAVSPTLIVPTWGTNPPTARRFNVQYEVQPPGAAPCGPPTTVHVKHTFSVRNTGQGSPGSGTVNLLLRNGGTTIDSQTIGSFPSNTTVQVTLEADVPYADVVAGNIDVHHSYLVWQPTTHPQYEVSNYSLVVTDVAADPSCVTAEFTQFLRHFVYAADGAIASHYDTTLEGSLYLVTGTAGVCQPADAETADQVIADTETLVLCDSAGTRFLRRLTFDGTGALTSQADLTLAGAPFAPVGAVSLCTSPVATDFDFAEEILCDANGTTFIRRFTFNSQTGAVTATVNLTLAGAAFVPVGAVGQCSNCCPAVVGNGCTNTGSGFYTAIRSTAGAISLIDSVTGAAVLAANIIPCPSDNTTRTLTAQGRVLTNATPWTPGGDVAGTLTSLTVTGVGGLWDLVDANGTALTGLPAGLTLTWSAEDDNTLTGPQSVTPQTGASVVANWTQR